MAPYSYLSRGSSASNTPGVVAIQRSDRGGTRPLAGPSDVPPNIAGRTADAAKVTGALPGRTAGRRCGRTAPEEPNEVAVMVDMGFTWSFRAHETSRYGAGRKNPAIAPTTAPRHPPPAAVAQPPKRGA